MTENEIGTIVLDKCFEIHRDLGPGMYETIYEAILTRELGRHGLETQRQSPIDVVYKGEKYQEGFRADVIVERKVLLEIKSLEKVNNSHKKQVWTYLRLTGIKLGYLLNFGEAMMKDGVYRIVNGLDE